MTKRDPIDRRARELAESGNYRNYDALALILIGEYGLNEVNSYKENGETRQYLNELCQAAYRGDQD